MDVVLGVGQVHDVLHALGPLDGLVALLNHVQVLACRKFLFRMKQCGEKKTLSLTGPQDHVRVVVEKGGYLVRPDRVPPLPVVVRVLQRQRGPLDDLVVLNEEVLAGVGDQTAVEPVIQNLRDRK